MVDIAILDFGGQYVFNIKRTFLELGYHAEIFPFDINLKLLKEKNVKGIVLSGGPYSIYVENAPRISIEFLESEIPILGICYGHQLLIEMLGGEIVKSDTGEFGFTILYVDEPNNPLFKGLERKEICWMSHKDIAVKLPQKAKILAHTKISKIAAFNYNNIYGVQFHPEVFQTPKGYIILDNFAKICGLEKKEWDVREFIDKSLQEIKEKVGSEKAIIAVSGGVDSTTLAVLAKKALGDNLIAVHVDTGLMRKKESRRVVEYLKKLGLNVIFIDASDKVFLNLKSVTSSDDKRKIIGRIFIEEFTKVADSVNAKWLLQGTIAPDIIESTRGQADKRKGKKHGGSIKLHHNVGGLPKEIKLKILEPFRELFKYQVRIIAKELGIDEKLVYRQPFPGPGLGCRITGEITREKVILLQEITKIAEEELAKYRPSQYFAALISSRYKPFKSMFIKNFLEDAFSYISEDYAIGVKGDERIIGKILLIYSKKWNEKDWVDILQFQNNITGKYNEICRVVALLEKPRRKKYGIILRAVDTLDFMTAIPTKVYFNHIAEVVHKILMNFDEISFVGYEITSKPAGTIELI
ncbi:MAG: glutamine-hydrolyzing GMP synthase [Thermoproteales archaeon]|nr:glutamine-hydrolyzing GMP synthase [Thermoproteales archaeon]